MECRVCGRPTEIVLDGVPICEECYEHAGSCCMEFGAADLWKEKEEEESREEAAHEEPAREERE